jgi:signal peptidase I
MSAEQSKSAEVVKKETVGLFVKKLERDANGKVTNAAAKGDKLGDLVEFKSPKTGNIGYVTPLSDEEKGVKPQYWVNKRVNFNKDKPRDTQSDYILSVVEPGSDKSEIIASLYITPAKKKENGNYLAGTNRDTGLRFKILGIKGL